MPENNVDRRDFARRVAASALTALPLAANTQTQARADEPDKAMSPADLIQELVKRQYPQHLNDEHLAAIRRDIESFLSRSRTLSSFPLVNADEPAFKFAAYRKEG